MVYKRMSSQIDKITSNVLGHLFRFERELKTYSPERWIKADTEIAGVPMRDVYWNHFKELVKIFLNTFFISFTTRIELHDILNEAIRKIQLRGKEYAEGKRKL